MENGKYQRGDHVTYAGQRVKFRMYLDDGSCIVTLIPDGLAIVAPQDLTPGWAEEGTNGS